MQPGEYTIGEFSIVARMSVKTLRFYHEKGILPPARVDPATGYRYYTTASADRARIVSTLRRLEFSVEEIREVLSECVEDEDAAIFLRRKQQEIQRRLRHLRKLDWDLTQIIESVELTAKGVEAMNVERKSVSSVEAITARYKGRYDEIGSRIGLLFKLAGRWAKGPVFALYWDPEYRESDADVEACLALKPEGAERVRRALARQGDGALTELEEGGVAVEAKNGDRLAVRTIPGAEVYALVHTGGYDSIGNAYGQLMSAMVDQGRKPKVPSREVYLKGPGMIFRGNPAKYRTEVKIPFE